MKFSVPRSLILTIVGVAATGLMTAGFVRAQSTNANSSIDRPIVSTAATTTPVGMPMMGKHGGQHLQAVADLLGISVSDLQTQLNNGTPLYKIMASHGWTLSKLQDKQISDAQTRLKDMVSSGFMTQAQADQALTNLKNQIQNGTDLGPGMGMMGHHGFGVPF